MGFKDYDFSSDSGWLAYRQSVEVTGSGEEFDHRVLRLKAKWYKRNVVISHQTSQRK
jgi:hypothetical protein